MPFPSASSLVLAGGPIVAVVGVVTSIGSPGDGGDVLTKGGRRRGIVREVWRGSESLEKGLPRGRSSARSMTALPVKCQRCAVQVPAGRGQSRVVDLICRRGRERTSLHPDYRLRNLRPLGKKGVLLCPRARRICTYPRQGLFQLGVLISLAEPWEAPIQLR
jgi:hypothetical protein